MKKASKILAIILVILMVMSTIPITASAASATSGKCGENLSWSYNSISYTLTISGTGDMYDYQNGWSSPWDSYDDSIRELVLDDRITSIGDWAFYYFVNVAEVDIPDGVTRIGEHAFGAWYSLTEVTIPDSVEEIEAFAFYGCDQLTCVTFPEGPVTIGNGAFEDCVSLTEMYIPENVTEIGIGVFSDCSSLKKITVDENNPYYMNDEYGVLFNKDKTVLLQYPCGRTESAYVIPDGVTTITEEAFYYCGNLKSVTIPESVTTIGKYAFTDWTMTLNYGGTEAQWKELVANNTEAAEQLAEYTVKCKDETVRPSGECGENVTWEFDSATGTLTISGNGYMPDCYYSDVSGYCDRPWDRFSYNDIKNVVIEEGVLNIGSDSFCFCDELESVTISSTVTSIGYRAFKGCEKLIKVNYAGTENDWWNIEIDTSNDDLTSAQICTSDYKVYSDSGEFGDNVVWSFDAKSKTLTISGEGAMDDDSGDNWMSEWLTGNYVYKFEGYRPWDVFKYDIERVVINDGITCIGYNNFRFCPNLKEVVIPASVTSIDYLAFRSDEKLTDVYYMGTEEQWNSIAIGKENEPLQNATKHYNYVACEHNYDITVVTEPTCEVRGYTTYICSKCNDSYVDNFVVKPHEYDAVVTAPTCTKQGYTTYTCSVCGYSERDDYISSTGHDYQVSGTVNPTCTSNGYIKYTCANGCGSSKKEKTESSLGHDYGTTVEIIEPTCTAKGYTKQTCARCRNVNKYDYVAALGHNYVATSTIAPNCIEKGYTIYTCSGCGEIQKDDYINATGHNYEWRITSEPTCTNNGTKSGICLVCGAENSVGVPSLGHDWSDEYQIDIAPTCTEDGQESRHCSRCDWKYSPKVIPAAHSYGDWEQVDDAKCGEYGKFERYCSLCGQIEVMNAPADHNYSIENIIVEATCITAGRKTLECSGCGKTTTETIPATGHNYESVVTAPTCTEKGFITYTCDCGNSYVGDYVDATGHDYKSEITTPATHLTEGVETFTCTCGDTYTETIDKLAEHNHNAVITAPTCTERGYTTYTCECGDTYIADYVDEFGHTEETIPAVAPTCTETGLAEGKVCSVCGETLTEQKELPANGHTPANAVEENYVAPTCTENGSVDKVVYCLECNEEISIETETIEAIGHADNDGDGYCDADNELLDPSVECECNCHKTGIAKFFFNLILFFQKIFGSNQVCDCGVAHY